MRISDQNMEDSTQINGLSPTKKKDNGDTKENLW